MDKWSLTRFKKLFSRYENKSILEVKKARDIKFCKDNLIIYSKNLDIFIFQILGQRYIISKNKISKDKIINNVFYFSLTPWLYKDNENGKYIFDDFNLDNCECIELNYKYPRNFIDIYNDIKAGYKVNKRGYRK